MSSHTRFDLQSHSIYSDGELAPAAVVECAAEAGVTLLALSDHDTVAGVDEAREAGESCGVEVVPATELSTKHGDREDLHILGYGIDAGSRELADQLEQYAQQRERRGQDMAERLRELGFHLDPAPLEARLGAGRTIGRPHLAEAVVGHPGNAERLAGEAIDGVSPFIASYLIAGTPAFVPRAFPTVPEAIDLIHRAGGTAVWAHPFWDIPEDDEVIETATAFVAEGLDGIEAFYPTHDAKQTALLADFCAQHGLLSTGSSDFHGPNHRLFSSFLAFDTYGHEPRLGGLGA